MTFIKGMYKTEDYFMPPHSTGPAGLYTTTITKVLHNGAIVDITYDNHPRFNRLNVFKTVDILHESNWSMPAEQLPEELFEL